MVAVNETFFVADVRRFSLADALEERLDDGALSEKALKIVGISSLRDASANRRFAFFPRLDVRLENERAKRKIGEGNGKRRRLDRRRDDDSASARQAGNRRAVVKQSPDVGAERFIVNLRKRVQ